MWLLTFFGALMMLLSLLMINSPPAFSRAIVHFSQQTYFHIFEILSRLLFGVSFIDYAPSTRAVLIHTLFGGLMVFSAIVLLIIGAEKHRAFAGWSVAKFCPIFPIAGLCSLLFGSYIIYTANF